MPYLYNQYLREGAGTCRSCRVKVYEPAEEAGGAVMPEEEAAPAGAELPEAIPWDRAQKLAEAIRESTGEEGMVPFAVGDSDPEYFGSLCPRRIRKMKDYVREECDRLENAGGFFYDEYPDRVRLDQACGRILRSMQADAVPEAVDQAEYSRDVIEMLLYQEVMERRRKRCRRE